MHRNKLLLPIAILLVFVASACNKKADGKNNLPPATGSGAAPMPDIPNLSKPAGGSGSGSSQSADPPTTFTGNLVAQQEVQVASKGSGTIMALTVDEGSKVKKGDVLFRLDSRDAQLMLRSGQTQLQGAKVALKQAQRERDRVAGLVAQNALPQQQLDQLDSQVESSKVIISGAQNTIAMAEKQLGDSTVRSPMAGVVIHKLHSVGEYVTMMPPSPVVVIQDQSSMKLKFSVPDSALTTLHQGDPVTVTLAALHQERVAKITEIAPMINPKTRTLELTALLDNCDGSLKPGLMAEVKLSASPTAVTPACGAAPAEKAAAPGAKPAAAKAPAAKTPAKAPAAKPAAAKPAAAKPAATKPAEAAKKGATP